MDTCKNERSNDLILVNLNDASHRKMRCQVSSTEHSEKILITTKICCICL